MSSATVKVIKLYIIHNAMAYIVPGELKYIHNCTGSLSNHVKYCYFNVIVFINTINNKQY